MRINENVNIETRTSLKAQAFFRQREYREMNRGSGGVLTGKKISRVFVEIKSASSKWSGSKPENQTVEMFSF